MKITLLIFGCLFSAYSFAGIYKCTDNNGKNNYQSKPCDSEQKTEQINIKTGDSIDSPDQEKQRQALAQKELDEKSEQDILLKKQIQLKQDAQSESAKNQFLIRNNSNKFSVFSIPPYIPDQLPELVKNYQNRLPDIERFRRLASEKALATAQCTRVEASELHGNSTKSALIFLVNCSSGKSFYFAEQELAR